MKTNRDLIDYVRPAARREGDDHLRPRRQGEDLRRQPRGADRARARSRSAEEQEAKGTGKKDKALGLELSDLLPGLAAAYRIAQESAKGVVVTHVKPVSPAADANLQEGDLILEVNGVPISSVEELQAQLKKLPKDRWVRFYVLRSIPRPQNFIAALKPE